MPRRRMDTKTIREILRLRSRNLSNMQIAQSVKKAKSSVNDIIRKAEKAGLKWPPPPEIDDQKLEEILYPKSEVVVFEGKALPEFSYIEKELTGKGVTRQRLWKEYVEACEEEGRGYYSYTRFCELLGEWLKKNRPPSMRQIHKAGEKCFVDYAGLVVNITDSLTGEVSKAQIFVGVMGASNYIFAEAAASQTLPDWLGSHTRMLEFFCGVPEIIVPDNLRSGVSRACRYDPEANPAYLQWANHYGTVVIPARPYKPKDKAKVENAVQVVERSVLAPIRNEEFTSIAQLNKRVAQLMEDANSKPFQKMEGCRGELFKEVDLPALRPLPPVPYAYTEIKKAKVHIDYHVEYKKRFYSVPWNYRGERVEVHASQNIVKIYFKNKLIAQHKRLRTGSWETEPAHMPENHREHERWTPQGLRNWAKQQGEEVYRWVDAQIESKDHPEQAYRVCLGLMSLSRNYPQRLNAACRVANRNGLMKLRQVKEVLKNGTDKLPLFEEEEFRLPQDHKNVRGPGEFR